ncbi:MAG TPA: vWA domain-containing protein [Actinomycetota bacterium]|nr:vWA domain-containing protein [Actinomycetota bacterium]
MSRFTGPTTRVVVGLLMLVTAVLPNALALAAADCSTKSGWWYTYDVRDFDGGGPITSFAIDAFHPTTMYATNGSQVLRTINGGCSWKPVFSMGDATPLNYGLRGEASTIQEVYVPRTPQGGKSVLLVIREETGGVVRPHVLRSTTMGDEWAPATGLPPAGVPETNLTMTSTDPPVGYLGIDLGGGTIDLLYRTVDGGATWIQQSDFTKSQELNRAADELAANPLNPLNLYAYGPGGLWESNDGGASFQPVQQLTGEEVVEVQVYQSATRQLPYLFAFRGPEHQDVLISPNGGRSWPRIDTPGVVDSAAYGRTPQDLLISVKGRIFFYDWSSEAWIAVTTPRPGIGNLVSDLAVEVDFYGNTAGTIERYDGPMRLNDPELGGGPIFDVPGLSPPEAARPPAPPALGPPRAKVKMKTGATRTVDYRLKLSEKTTKLDLFFLLDTSDTMSGTIQGLIYSVSGIISRLNASGLDAQFGIGVSRAYTDTAVPRPPCRSEDEQNCERNFIYRRLVDLSDFSNADQLREALASLRAEAGGRFDSQLGALYQIATGAGQDDAPPGMQESDVPPGLDATFRTGGDTLRLVFVATDEPFATGDEGARDPTQVSDFGRITPPDIPSFDEVEAAFEAIDAKVLGLAIGPNPESDKDPTGGGPTPHEDMEEIALRTGALAPDGGVDCDADGVADLAAGEPLVCSVRRHNVAEGKNLAASIEALVRAERGTTDVELEVVRGEDVVAGVTPPVHSGVVLQQPNLLDYEVTYRCPHRLRGETVTVELAATTPLRTLDSVTTTVTCLEEVEEPPLPLDPVVAFGLVLPPLLPPAPPPIAANAPSAQGQAQSQSQAQAQAAMAAQEQEQPQLAYVGATLDHREALEEELAMSDRRRRSEVPQWATLGTGAVFMSLAYGWLTLSRGRVRVQRVRVRRY